MEYEFLSPEWIEAARAIRTEYADQVAAPDQPVRMNVVVTQLPFPDHGDRLHAHVDTTSGGVFPELGHLDQPEVTVTLDYATARDLFVGRDPQAISQAFLAGRLLVEGDLTRLLLLQDAQPTPEQAALAVEVAGRLAAITR